jgi:hypothetical protein
MWSKCCHRVHLLLGLETTQLSMQVERGCRYLIVNADYHGHTEVIPHIAVKVLPHYWAFKLINCKGKLCTYRVVFQAGKSRPKSINII